MPELGLHARFRFVALIVGLLLTTWAGAAHAAGNDQFDMELRVDLAAVNQAHDYTTWIWDEGSPAGLPGDFLGGWFGVDLAQANGQTYSGQFTQVGLMNLSDGVHWFVYTEAGAQCIRGTVWWNGLGCLSTTGDLGVGANAWTRVELVTYGQGFWIARVYDQSSAAHDVAYANSASMTIYRSMKTFEESWQEVTDPGWEIRFFHWHPRYMVSDSGFTDWTASSVPHDNYLFVYASAGNQVCPNLYGVEYSYQGDPRYWITGNGGLSCGQDSPF